METTTPELESNPGPAGKRSTFLMVICILTFIGSGFGILGGMFTFVTADAVATMNTRFQDRVEPQESPGFLKSIFHSAAENSDPAKIKESALASLLSNLLTLTGAIMMFKLRKPGFYLYVFGILIYIIVPVLFLGKFLGTISAVTDGFFGIAFIVMYGVNLKCMNK
jgi:hypothetical protein